MRVILSSSLLLAPFVDSGFVFAGILYHQQGNAPGQEAQLGSLPFGVVHSTGMWAQMPPIMCVVNSVVPLPTVSMLISDINLI